MKCSPDPWLSSPLSLNTYDHILHQSYTSPLYFFFSYLPSSGLHHFLYKDFSHILNYFCLTRFTLPLCTFISLSVTSIHTAFIIYLFYDNIQDSRIYIQTFLLLIYIALRVTRIDTIGQIYGLAGGYRCWKTHILQQWDAMEYPHRP